MKASTSCFIATPCQQHFTIILVIIRSLYKVIIIPILYNPILQIRKLSLEEGAAITRKKVMGSGKSAENQGKAPVPAGNCTTK